MNLSGLRPLYPEVPAAGWERLGVFADLLAGPARRRGLVGFDSDEAALEIGRSLLLLPLVAGRGNLVDVGTGAGLPGIALAAALGGATLVEPRRRAVAFLEMAAREMGLSVEVVAEPAELAGHGALRERAGAVVARLVGPPAVAAELAAPLCRVGGLVVLAAAPEAELSLPQAALDALGIGPPESRRLARSAELSHRVHMIPKVSPTASEFPRRPGVPRRRPLGRPGRGAAGG